MTEEEQKELQELEAKFAKIEERKALEIKQGEYEAAAISRDIQRELLERMRELKGETA